MSQTSGGRPLGRTSARTGLVVLVAAIAGLAVAAGPVLATGVLVGAAVLAGVSVRDLQHDAPARVAAASAGLVLAVVGLVAGIVLGYAAGALPITALAAVALLYGAIDAFTGLSPDAGERASEAVWRTARVFVLASLLAFVWHVAVTLGGAWFLATHAFAASTSSVLAAVVSIQFGVLLAGLLFGHVADVLESWLPRERELRDAVDTFAFSAGSVRAGYVVTLVTLTLAALVTPVANAVEGVLAASPVLYRVLDLTLLTGWLQVGLGVVLLALVSVWFVAALVGQLVGWAGPVPGTTIVDAGGALAAVVLVPVAIHGAVVLTGRTADHWLVTAVGPTTLALLGTFLALLVVADSIWGLSRADVGPLSPNGATGFAVASAGLFGVTLLVADRVPALYVFLGVAAAILVWDLGRHAVDVGPTTSGSGDVDVVEFVHATTAGGALLVGVALTLVVALALRSVTVAIPPGRASVALVLTLGGLAAFAYAVQR